MGICLTRGGWGILGDLNQGLTLLTSHNDSIDSTVQVTSKSISILILFVSVPVNQDLGIFILVAHLLVSCLDR